MAIDHRDELTLALEARVSILGGARGADLLQHLKVLCAALRSHRELCGDRSFTDHLYEAIRWFVRLPVFARHPDRVTLRRECRLLGAEAMCRMDLIYSEVFFLSMLNSVGNGPFAVQALLAVSDPAREGGAIYERSRFVGIISNRKEKTLERFASLEAQPTEQDQVRTTLSNQASFMAASGTRAGREFVEDLLSCPDYDLRMHVLTTIGNLGAQTVPSLYALGEFKLNQLKQDDDDSRDIAAKTLATMTALAKAFSQCSVEQKQELLPQQSVSELREWARQNEWHDLAKELTEAAD